MWHQHTLTLAAASRGFHLVTAEIERQLPTLPDFSVGLAHLHILHTSAGLTINENADPTVRVDFAEWFDRNIRENESYYRHTFEGPDDMPAHIKSTLCGPSLTIPIRRGRLYLGTWQGIYLCEFRNCGGPRTLVVTLHGE